MKSFAVIILVVNTLSLMNIASVLTDIARDIRRIANK